MLRCRGRQRLSLLHRNRACLDAAQERWKFGRNAPICLHADWLLRVHGKGVEEDARQLDSPGGRQRSVALEEGHEEGLDAGVSEGLRKGSMIEGW